jgi:hypothetical protein
MANSKMVLLARAEKVKSRRQAIVTSLKRLLHRGECFSARCLTSISLLQGCLSAIPRRERSFDLVPARGGKMGKCVIAIEANNISKHGIKFSSYCSRDDRHFASRLRISSPATSIAWA